MSYDETADGEALRQNLTHAPRQSVRARRRRLAELSDEAADRDSRELIQQRPHRRKHLASDVLEIDVHAVRTCGRKAFVEIGRTMVNRLVEAESLFYVAAFLRSAGYPDGASPGSSRELPDQRSDASARRGHHHRFPRCRPAYRTHSDIGRETRGPQDSEPRRRRHQFRIQLAHVLALRQTGVRQPVGARTMSSARN